MSFAPHRITISNRNGKPTMFLEGHNTYYGTGTDTKFTLNSYSGERRDSKGEDIKKAALICDYLPNIDFVGSMGGVSVSEINPLLSDRHNFVRILFNTSKPIFFTSWSLAGLSDIYDMVVAVRGSAENFRRNPFIIHYFEPTTPAKAYSRTSSKIAFLCRKRYPYSLC